MFCHGIGVLGLILAIIALFFALVPYLHGRYVDMLGDVEGTSKDNRLIVRNAADVSCGAGQVYNFTQVLTKGLALGPTCVNISTENATGTAGCYGGVTNSSIIVPEVCFNEFGRAISASNVTFALSDLNGSALTGTPHQWDVIDEGGGVLRGFTPQDIDLDSNVRFGTAILAPELDQLVFDGNETLRIGGRACGADSPRAGFYDHDSTAPQLQLGLFCLNSSDAKPYIAFNVWWDASGGGVWRNSKPNVSGILMFDAYEDGQLYIVSTDNASSINQTVAITADIARFEQQLVTSFVPIRIGVDTTPEPVGVGSGIAQVYEGNSYVDVARTSDVLTFLNEYPIYQRVTYDDGEVRHLYSAYMDTSGFVRTTSPTYDAAQFSASRGDFVFSRSNNSGVDAAASFVEKMRINEAYTQVFDPVYTRGAFANDVNSGYAQFSLQIGSTITNRPTGQFAATNTSTIVLGFGMYVDDTDFRQGVAVNATYGIVNRARDSLDIVRAASTSAGSVINPTTLVSFREDATDFYPGVRFPSGGSPMTPQVLDAYSSISGTIVLNGILAGDTMDYVAVRVGRMLTVTFSGSYRNNATNCTTALAGQPYIFIPLPAELASTSLPVLNMVPVVDAGDTKPGLLSVLTSTSLAVGCLQCDTLLNKFTEVAPCGVASFTLTYPVTS